MGVNNPQKKTGNEMVSVSAWDACINSGDNMLVLSCKVTTNDASSTIEGIGLIINTDAGATLATNYTDLSSGVESASPALNLPGGDFKLGDGIEAVVSGTVGGQHYFFEQPLTIGTC